MVSLLFLGVLLGHIVLGSAQNQTCYDKQGRGYTGNSQCPGSYACCADVSYCDQHRFCLQSNQIVAAPCANQQWEECVQICTYDTGTGLLPRIQDCGGGWYCCTNDPSCCQGGRSTLLNAYGGIVATTPLSSSTTSSTSSSSTAPASAPATTTTPAAASTPTLSVNAESSSSSLSTGAKAGIGIGIAGGAIAIGVLAFFLFRARRKNRAYKQQRLDANPQQMSMPPPHGQNGPVQDFYATDGKSNHHANYAAEMPQHGLGGAESAYYRNGPQKPGEMDASEAKRNGEVHEMPN